MAIKLVTEPGVYNGKFRKAGQSYDTDDQNPPDKPDVLNEDDKGEGDKKPAPLVIGGEASPDDL